MMTDLIKKIYSSDPQLKNVKHLIRLMIDDLRLSRQLAIRLMIRNISSQYRQTYLGYIWAILPAIFTTMIFVYLNNKKILNIDDIETPYVIYVISGMVLWQVFTDSINSPLKQATQSIGMLRKIMFPRESIIIAGIGEVIVNFSIRSILLLIVFIIYDASITLQLIYVPFGVISLIILGTVIGLLLLPFGLLYQDIGKFLIMVTTLWFFITPVIYPIPEQGISGLIKYNPVTPLLVTSRSMLINGDDLYVLQSLLVTSTAMLFLFIGWIIYRLAMPHLIERMGS